MKFKKKLFYALTCVILIWGAIFAYNRMTDGFSIYQMSSSLPPCPQFEVLLSEEKKNALQDLLSQPFHYIGKGCQFYVFSSADEKIVIKFLKHKHLRPFAWLGDIPMPKQLKGICEEKMNRRKERTERLFASCKLAYEKMADETGLLFVHLNRTPVLEKEIILFDKLGFKHTVSLDQYEFIIQKKAVSVRERFSQLKPSELPQKVDQLTQLVLSRCQKGIRDRDRSFVQNVAFSKEEDQAVFIDIGQFYEDPTILRPEEQERDLAKRIHNLNAWLERYFPDFHNKGKPAP